MKKLFSLLAALLGLSAWAQPAPPPPFVPPDPARVAAIEASLSNAPFAVGARITDRTFWDKFAGTAEANEVLERATALLNQPIPELPEELFMEYRRNGNRQNYERVYSQRIVQIDLLATAEALENRGRLIPRIETLFAAFAAMRTWVPSGHDGQLRNYNDTAPEVELTNSRVAYSWAQLAWILGPRLRPEFVAEIQSHVRRRVVDLIGATIAGHRKPDWWFTIDNNWNAVCLANVVGAALITVEDKTERARFLATAEQYSVNFLRGILDDGYCTEGLSYWNYGYSNYVKLAEVCAQATGGTVNLFERPKVRALSLYPRQLEIFPGIYPTYADGVLGEKPDADLVRFLNHRLGLGVPSWDRPGPDARSLAANLPLGLAYATAAPAPAATMLREDPLRGWFPDAMVYVGRPAIDSASTFGVSIKGGHNAEHHNHNDVGNFVVVVGKSSLIIDPGAETYTKRTFGAQRYESKALNSFGHSVPEVAGTLQRTGREAAARILQREFTDAADTLTLDLQACYEVPALQKLERTYVYQRTGNGSFVVTDRVAFATPQSYATALITQARWEQPSPKTLRFRDQNDALDVEIVASAPFTITATPIGESMRSGNKPERLLITFIAPITEATLTLQMKPAAR